MKAGCALWRMKTTCSMERRRAKGFKEARDLNLQHVKGARFEGAGLETAAGWQGAPLARVLSMLHSG
ncbi:hypothetical protein KI387_041515, partial [Taxus chinensis]